MALDKEDKSFKALINKEYTSPTRKFYQEVGTDTINMNAREVWTQEPDSTPATAVSDGTAKLYTKFSLTADPTYPTEAYSFVSSSEAQRNFISDKYGSSYEIELYDDSDTRIYKTDDIDWVFDYQTGILNIGEPSQVTSQGYSTPFKITAYQYIGAVLSQSVGSTGIISAEWDGSRDGDASITGSLYVTSTISGSNITGSSVEATSITGSVVSASNFYGDATLGTAKVSDLTSGRVVLAGTDGELEDSGNFTFDGTSLTVTGDITASANISASAFYGDGTGITGVTAEWDGSHNGNAEITGSLTIKAGHIDLISSGGDNYFRGFFGFPRVQEVSSSLSGIDPIADELYTNSGSYNGYAVFIVTGSTPALSGTFASNNKFYFNEDGVWHPSPFYTKD